MKIIYGSLLIYFNRSYYVYQNWKYSSSSYNKQVQICITTFSIDRYGARLVLILVLTGLLVYLEINLCHEKYLFFI